MDGVLFILFGQWCLVGFADLVDDGFEFGSQEFFDDGDWVGFFGLLVGDGFIGVLAGGRFGGGEWAGDGLRCCAG